MELKIDYGPGYRVYLTRRGANWVQLLAGGDKSTQQRDIEAAIRLSKEISVITIETTRWDVQDALRSPEDCAAFIEAAVEEAADDPAFISLVLGEVARARGMAQTARDVGMTREGLYKALSPEGNPSFATVLKVLSAFGLRLHVAPA